MATARQLSGGYSETCSCDFLCPCIPSNLTARPTRGDCYFIMVFDIGQGRYGTVGLDGLKFAVAGRTPGVMLEGNWAVGLIVDDRASAEQEQALTAIVGGQAGLEQELASVESGIKKGEPLYVDNTMHPASSRLALARAGTSRLSAFNLKWEDTSGRNNGHYAAFSRKN